MMDFRISNFLLLKFILFFIFFHNLIKETNSTTCTTELEKCTSAMNPLLKNVSYMFPSSKEEVNNMCSTWSNIVDCVRQFVKKCFNQQRRQTFNLAVESSIGTVHAICVSDEYQSQYLEKAVCLREVSIKNCKFYFNLLVDIVANPKSKDDHLCCAYAKFRKCVDRPLAVNCGDQIKNLMDHSLTFLITKCDNPSSNANPDPNIRLKEYDNCQLPISLTGLPTKRNLDDNNHPQFDQNGNFYPINPQLVNSYPIKKSQNNQPSSIVEEDTDNETTTTIGKESNRQPKIDNTVEDEFRLNNANRFNRQDDETETDKHRDYSKTETESPEYMMSLHFSPEELHNNSQKLNYNLINLFFIIYLIFKFL